MTTTHDHQAAAAAVLPEDRARWGRRAQLLAGASVAYNTVEAVIAVAAGLVAGSVALVGFGLDSVIEVSSGLVILWQFRHRLPQSREQQALRLIAGSFFALAAYVTFDSVRALVTGTEPDAFPGGHGTRRDIARDHAVPVVGAAPDRPGAALQLGRRRLHADAAVHVHERCAARWAGPERDARLVVGRPGRRARHRRHRGEGGP